MSRRPARPTGPKTYVSKDFTEDEIDVGVQKLRRRIAEVTALKDKGVRFDDQAVKTAEFNVQETIREVFGDDSAEYDRHRYHDIWQGPIQIGMSDYEIQAGFEAGIAQTIKMLEGLIQRLEEKRWEVSQGPRAPVALRDLDIHPRILSTVADLFNDGHYANAVLNGSIALTNHVKEKSGRHDLDGADLMRTVFSVNAPILVFNEMKDKTDRDEQEGMMHLFEGVALGVRNPRAHELFDDRPQRALEYVVLLSLLAKRVDESHRTKKSPQ